jgi:hypothetical protein
LPLSSWAHAARRIRDTATVVEMVWVIMAALQSTYYAAPIRTRVYGSIARSRRHPRRDAWRIAPRGASLVSLIDA